jgi:hypothetical protein
MAGRYESNNSATVTLSDSHPISVHWPALHLACSTRPIAVFASYLRQAYATFALTDVHFGSNLSLAFETTDDGRSGSAQR